MKSNAIPLRDVMCRAFGLLRSVSGMRLQDEDLREQVQRAISLEYGNVCSCTYEITSSVSARLYIMFELDPKASKDDREIGRLEVLVNAPASEKNALQAVAFASLLTEVSAVAAKLQSMFDEYRGIDKKAELSPYLANRELFK